MAIYMAFPSPFQATLAFFCTLLFLFIIFLFFIFSSRNTTNILIIFYIAICEFYILCLQSFTFCAICLFLCGIGCFE